VITKTPQHVQLLTAPTVQRRRGATIALWVVQIGLAAMFLMAGGSS